jgi:hypothetical protein
MSSSTAPQQDPTVRALDQIERAVARLRAQPLGGEITDFDLSWSIDRLQRIANQIEAEQLRRLGAFDDRAAYIAEGARSGTDWAARKLNLTPGQSRKLIETADRLNDLPETSRKLADGEISVNAAAAAAKAADDIHNDDLAEFDQLAADEAAKHNPKDLRKKLDAFAAAKNADHLAERERRHFQGRRIRRWTDHDGFERADLRLPAWQMAHIDAAIAPLARKTSKDDARTAEQRRADALTSLCEQALNTGELPDVAVERPHIIMIRHDDDRPATLDGFGPVSSATEALIACDGHTTEVVVDHRGHPLVVNPTQKDPTTKQRLAVIARDQHCVGCGAAASRCQVHHTRWRRKGGLTIVSNLVLVCLNCHWHIHHHGWVVTQDANGRFSAAPPDEVPAAEPEPLRHTA